MQPRPRPICGRLTPQATRVPLPVATMIRSFIAPALGTEAPKGPTTAAESINITSLDPMVLKTTDLENINIAPMALSTTMPTIGTTQESTRTRSTGSISMERFLKLIFIKTRSYAALRAADLEWIVGPGYSFCGYILEKNHEKPTWNHEKP